MIRHWFWRHRSKGAKSSVRLAMWVLVLPVAVACGILAPIHRRRACSGVLKIPESAPVPLG